MSLNRLLLAGVLMLSTSASALCSNQEPDQLAVKEKPVAKRSARKNVTSIATPKKPEGELVVTYYGDAAEKQTSKTQRKPGQVKAPQKVKVAPPTNKREEREVPASPVAAAPTETFINKKSKWMDSWKGDEVFATPARPVAKDTMMHSSSSSTLNFDELNDVDNNTTLEAAGIAKKRSREELLESALGEAAAEEPATPSTIRNSSEDTSKRYAMSQSQDISALDDMTKLISSGDSAAIFKRGMSCFERYNNLKKAGDNAYGNDFKQAIELFQAGQLNGHTGCKNMLGVVYLEQQNYSLAKIFFEAAIKDADPDAMFNLGYLYHKGFIDQAVNFERAKHYYKMAADKNHLKASLLLSRLQMSDNQNKTQFKEGLDRLEKIVKSGVAKSERDQGTLKSARHLLPDYQLKYALKCLEGGADWDKDLNEAILWLEKAKGTNPRAMFELGRLLLEGPEEIRNLKAAVAYLKQAKISKIDDAERLYNLALEEQNAGPFFREDAQLKVAKTRKDFDDVIVAYGKKCAGEFEGIARQKIIDVHYQLAFLYKTGTAELPFDLDEFFKLYEFAVAGGHKEANENKTKVRLTHAKRLLKKNDVEKSNEAIALLKSLSDSDLSVQEMLIDIYANGMHGIKKDLKAAIEFCRKAVGKSVKAEKRLHDLNCEMAVCYLDGNGVEVDPAKAMEFLESGVAAKHANSKEQYRRAVLKLAHIQWSQNSGFDCEQAVHTLTVFKDKSDEMKKTLSEYCKELGSRYLNGTNVAVDLDKAVRYLGVADSMGDTQVVEALKKAKLKLANIWCLSRDRVLVEKALNLLDSLDDEEVREKTAKAQLWLAKDLLKSKNPMDIEKAKRLLGSAEKFGNSVVLYEIGKIYFFGDRGLTKDLLKAKTYFTQAMDKGLTDAKIKVGEIEYMEAQEFLKQPIPDHEKAIALMKSVVAKGVNKSEKRLEQMTYAYALNLLSGGNGVSRNYRKALSWMIEVANLGNTDACHKVAKMYLKGEGTDVNLPEAINWLSKADIKSAEVKKDLNEAKIKHGRHLSNDENATRAQLEEACRLFVDVSKDATDDLSRRANQLHMEARMKFADVLVTEGGEVNIKNALEMLKPLNFKIEALKQRQAGIHHKIARALKDTDPETAIQSFEFASAAGILTAKAELAELYLQKGNSSKALDLLKDASDTDPAFKEQFMKVNLIVGKQILADQNQDERSRSIVAKLYLELAANYGLAEAQHYLAKILAQAKDKSCLEWFKKAADQSYPDAQYAYAIALSSGDLLPQNIGESLRLTLLSKKVGSASPLKKHMRYNPVEKSIDLTQDGSPHAFLDVLDLDAPTAFEPMKNYILKLKAAFVYLRSKPFMVNAFQLTPEASAQLSGQNAPALIHEFVHDDRRLVTVGQENIVDMQNTLALLHDEADQIDVKVKELATYLMVKAQIAAAKAEDDDALVIKLAGNIFNLPVIEKLGQAKLWSGLMMQGVEKALKELGKEKAAFDKFKAGPAQIINKKSRVLDGAKALLEQELAWNQQVVNVLGQVKTSSEASIKDSYGRDIACAIHPSYRPIIATFEEELGK